MANIEVYDSKNEERLLGTLKVTDSMRGEGYSVALMTTLPRHAPSWSPAEIQASRGGARMIDFHIKWSRRIIAAGQFMRTIEEKSHLTTSASLEDLLKLDRFTLPGETHGEANHRRADFY